MKIFLPISHNGNCDVKSGYAACLASAFNGCHIHIEEMGGSHADRQCSNMANFFLSKTDCDVMLIIDCDTVFSERDVQRALGHIERGHKAVWGLYPKKQDECIPCLNTWPTIAPPDEHGLVNVRRAGRGFLMVAREVFELLKEENGGPAKRFHNHEQTEWAFFRSGVVDGDYSAMIPGFDDMGYPHREWITEDWHFCEDIRIHLGIPTLVDTGIILAHVGSKTYRFPVERLIRTDSNISSWREIHGWFDYEEFYRFLVNEIPDGGNFVEVGCWLGRSLGAFAEFSREAKKAIWIGAVDTFNGKPANDEHAAILETHGGNVEMAFRANIHALGVDARVWATDSVRGADFYEDGTLDAVFIDADHSEEAVSLDISAWWPKVKPGGILAGHDFDWPGVRAGVADRFPIGKESQYGTGEVKTMGRCWYVRKPLAPVLASQELLAAGRCPMCGLAHDVSHCNLASARVGE